MGLFTAAGVVPCGGNKRLPVHHHSADYIFWSFGIIEFIFSHLKIEFRLSWCLGAWAVLNISLLVMNRINKTEFAIFISLILPLPPNGLAYQNLLIFVDRMSRHRRSLESRSDRK